MKHHADTSFPLPRLTRRSALASGLAALLPGVALADTAIDAPVGGWRASPAQQQDFVQEVHYPASSVNTNGRSAAALIRGHIAASSKPADGGPRTPARLIVDGIAIPLLTDEKGGFARPWSFGAGSHGVEVRSPNGEVARRQFYEAQASRVPARLRVVLSWDSDSTDLDLHVVSPDGQHVFYADRVAANGGALDVDVTTGFGPEIFATPSPVRGAYHVFVNYFGSGDSQGEVITTAQVAIIQEEGTAREKQQVFRVPMRKPGELTLVRSFLVA